MPARARSPQRQKALGRAIRDARGEELSQEALADRAEMHRTYIGGVERGERNPSYVSLLRISDALGIKLSELIRRAGE